MAINHLALSPAKAEYLLNYTTDPQSFVKTIGLEVVRPQQIRLGKPASETAGSRPQLLMALEELPDVLVAEVADFAEFLRQKQQRQMVAGERVR